ESRGAEPPAWRRTCSPAGRTVSLRGGKPLTAAIHDWRTARARLQAPKEIRSLNAIRGLAALMVATFHAPILFGVSETLPHAYLAVDLFFVLSSFVMLHAYEARITGGLKLGRFFQLR